MIRILIADDHAVVREGVKRIIGGLSDGVVTGEAASGSELLTRVRNERWDLILLDLTFPGGSGLDLLKQIKSEYPKLPILVLSMHPEENYAVRALRAGAAGYLTKESAPDQLVLAIHKVLAGGKYVSPTLAETLLFEIGVNREGPLHRTLSDRELQVMCLIASGKTVKQISDELALSSKTISTYRTRVLEKMGLKNNAELTNYAIRNNLVE